MGIYDRDYIRDDERRWYGSLGGGRVHIKLIVACVIIFLIQLMTLDRNALTLSEYYGWFTTTFWADSEAINHGQIWRLLTCAFLHSAQDPWHIIINMLILWWAGRDVEGIYGSREFLGMYLVAAVFASVVSQVAILIGLQNHSFGLGASGAISAVIVIFAFHYPHRTILLFFVLPVPVWLIAVVFVAKDAIILFSGQNTGIGVGAHVGGALFGFLYYRNQFRVTKWIPKLRWPQWRSRRNSRLRIYDEEPARKTPRAAEPAAVTQDRSEVDEHLEAKLDAVLEKVARSGQDSLSAEERDILMRASEVFKKKRH